MVSFGIKGNNMKAFIPNTEAAGTVGYTAAHPCTHTNRNKYLAIPFEAFQSLKNSKQETSNS